MAEFAKELKEKLKQAKTLDEARQILQDHNEDPSLAKDLWKEIVHFKQKVSMEELEAISGGADRDYLKDGCAATVEADSWCGSNDACYIWSVIYDNKPTDIKCPDCGGMLCSWDQIWVTEGNLNRYNCAGCGGFFQEKDVHHRDQYIRIR